MWREFIFCGKMFFSRLIMSIYESSPCWLSREIWDSNCTMSLLQHMWRILSFIVSFIKPVFLKSHLRNTVKRSQRFNSLTALTPNQLTVTETQSEAQRRQKPAKERPAKCPFSTVLTCTHSRLLDSFGCHQIAVTCQFTITGSGRGSSLAELMLLHLGQSYVNGDRRRSWMRHGVAHCQLTNHSPAGSYRNLLITGWFIIYHWSLSVAFRNTVWCSSHQLLLTKKLCNLLQNKLSAHKRSSKVYIFWVAAYKVRRYEPLWCQRQAGEQPARGSKQLDAHMPVGKAVSLQHGLLKCHGDSFSPRLLIPKHILLCRIPTVLRVSRTGKPFVLCNPADTAHDSKTLQTDAAFKVFAD